MSSTKIDTPARVPPTKRLRVLIADDVQTTRRSTRLMLSLISDVEVVAIAQNGREAVELAKKHDVHIAFMDVKMPFMDGLTATQALRQHNPDLICIICSTERDSQTLRQALIAGASEYLIKPFTADELNETVGRAVTQIREKQERWGDVQKFRKERDSYMVELAKEYAKSRRTDDKALEVFETLAQNPYCDVRWLRYLAIICIVREDWGRLKHLAARLEKRNNVLSSTN